jgi:hypothetical protein
LHWTILDDSLNTAQIDTVDIKAELNKILDPVLETDE